MARMRSHLGPVVRRSARIGGGAIGATARRVRGRSDLEPKPKQWESSVLDDLADNRPWNLLLKLTRRWALHRLAKDQPGGVTVVIVNWETGFETATTLAAVRHFSPPETQIFVLDNASQDGSAERFRKLDPSLRVLRLPVNVGHAIALDLGTHLARTEFVVTLDSDAFPLDHGWMDLVTSPLRDPAVVLAGSVSKRGFVHPMLSCVRRRAFVERKLSWQPWRVRDEDVKGLVWGVERFDAGELMTPRLAPGEAVFLERTPNRVEGLPGMTVCDLVYHHGGVTRAKQAQEVTSPSWDHAVISLLPPELVPARGPGA